MALSLAELEQRISEGKYSQEDLHSLLGNFEGYLRQGKTQYQSKVALIKSAIDRDPLETKADITNNDKVEMSMDEQVARKFLQLKKSADGRGKEWNLSLSDIKKLLSRKTCYYLGVRFTEDGKYARTVDRIDSNKGYVKGNVVACTYWVNQMKNELYELPDPMVKQMKKLIEVVDNI